MAIRAANVSLPSLPFWGERGWGWPDENLEQQRLNAVARFWYSPQRGSPKSA